MTMKPASSRASTVVLPSRSPNARANASVSSLVIRDGVTSIKAITGGGLKKCSPITWSGRAVAEASVAMEARLSQVVPVGETGYTMLLGNVLRFHLREGLLRPNGMVDAELLRPLGRLAGDEYATVGRVLEMKRPPT